MSILEKFYDVNDLITLKLRMNEPVDAKDFEEYIKVLTEIDIHFKKDDCLPKDFVMCLIDIPGAIYPSIEDADEVKKKLYFYFFDKIMDNIRSICQ